MLQVLIGTSLSHFARGIMSLMDDIIQARSAGTVRCGVTERSPSLPEVARAFGLGDNPSDYHAISRFNAHCLLAYILNREQAYNVELMLYSDAEHYAKAFLDLFGTEGVVYYTNGDFYKDLDKESRANKWNPVTPATIDTGVIVLGPTKSGCLWVEDED
jgi:hypothetical protein